jgi:hypothetical protein
MKPFFAGMKFPKPLSKVSPCGDRDAGFAQSGPVGQLYAPFQSSKKTQPDWVAKLDEFSLLGVNCQLRPSQHIRELGLSQTETKCWDHAKWSASLSPIVKANGKVLCLTVSLGKTPKRVSTRPTPTRRLGNKFFVRITDTKHPLFDHIPTVFKDWILDECTQQAPGEEESE